eukprot:gene15000-20289_t
MNTTVIFNYLNKSEVHEILNISERTLENMIRDQQFPRGVRIGKTVYWTPNIVQAWLDAKFKAQEQLAKTLTATEL